MELEREYFSANIVKRGMAFLIDAIVSFLPAFIMFFVFTGAIFHESAVLYPFPLIGTATLAISLTSEVNEAVNTENGIYLLRDDDQYENVVSTNSSRYNVALYATASRMLAVISVVFYCIYSAACVLMYNGKTVGKKLMNINVVNLDKNRSNKKSFVLREVIGKIVLNSIPVVPVISIVTIIFTKKHLAIHDIIGKTQVVE